MENASLQEDGKSNYQIDYEQFSLFLESSKNNSLDTSNPVYIMTDKFSKNISYNCDRAQDAEDLRQRVLIILLLKARYEGISSLKTYIYKIVFNERMRMFREEQNLVSLDEVIQNERLASISSKTRRNMESDPRLAKVMKNSSGLVCKVMRIIANFEKNRAPRKSEILKALKEENPNEKFSRYGVEQVLKTLKRRLS